MATCIRQDRYDNLIPFVIPGTRLRKTRFEKGKFIKGFELEKRNERILKKHWKALMNSVFLEITLMFS